MQHPSSILVRLRRLMGDRRGAVALILALSLVPLVCFSGVTIDYARLVHMKTALQAAADAAAISGAAANFGNTAQQTAADNTDGPQAIATSFFADAWLPPKSGLTSTVTAQTGTGGVTVTVNATAQVKMSFLALLQSQIPVSVTATAVAAAPSTASDVFPFAISQCVFNQYWSTQAEVTIDSSYHTTSDCTYGQWTSFTSPTNSDSTTQGYLSGGCGCSLSIGTDIYIQDGTKANLYSDAASLVGQTVLIATVNTLNAGDSTPIVGFAAFHIDSAAGGSTKAITGHFVDNYSGSDVSGGNTGNTYDGVYSVTLTN